LQDDEELTLLAKSEAVSSCQGGNRASLRPETSIAASCRKDTPPTVGQARVGEGPLTSVHGRSVSGVLLGLFVAILIAFVASGCSSDGDNSDGGGLDSAITKLNGDVSPKAADWASAVAAGYLAQAQSGGQLNFLALQQQLAPQTQSLTNFICSRLKDDKAFSKDENTDAAQLAAGRVVDEAVARALAGDPQLLIKAGLTRAGNLPPFMLKDPAPPAETALDPAALQSVIKPEFLDSNGGLRLPTAQDSMYAEFQRWLYEPSLDNKLLEQSTATGTQARTAINACPSG
jgi:hypothetical protein